MKKGAEVIRALTLVPRKGNYLVLPSSPKVLR